MGLERSALPKTDPVSIACETHGLAGNFVLPDGASAGAPVPGVLFVGGPGPIPMSRYSDQGAKHWPVLWSEVMGDAGLAALCYDQRGSGLSSGLYHEADWNALYEDARAAAEVLSIQPEVGRIAAIAWGDGCSFALQLAVEGRVAALVLLAPPFHTSEERYARGVAALAAKRGLSDRVVQLRINQWKQEILATARRVEAGETTSSTDLGGRQVTTNLVRLLQTLTYSPAEAVPHVQAPALLLHGEDDSAIAPAESAAMASAMGDRAERITYPGAAHFLYREPQVLADATAWLKRSLT